MANWYKPHLKSVYNAQDKTFVSRLNRLRFFHDRRVLKFLRWKKGDLGRRLRGIHSLRWYKLRFRFGLKFYNFSSKKRRKLRAFRQNNMYKVGLDRKKNFLSFYRKFDESKIRIWFKEYYNKSRQYKVLNFFKLFETRLDVLCFRMKLLPTIFLANTFIKNTGILVNYTLVKEAGKRVAIGDLISFEDPLQWSFFSSRFAEQLWKRWHRFKELNIQRKKTRLLVFREYYKKYSNIVSLDKKKQNITLFSNLENNWNFNLYTRDKKKINSAKKNLVTFDNTFWILTFFSKKKIITTIDPYLELINSLLRVKTNLVFQDKKKILALLLHRYFISNNLVKTKKYSFFSLVQYYRYRFDSFFAKKWLIKTNLIKNNVFLKDFIQYLKFTSSGYIFNKNFILLKTLYRLCPSSLSYSYLNNDKNKVSTMKLDSFLNFQKQKIKYISKVSSKNNLKNLIKENTLILKINFWVSNLLPFLRFNLNLKQLIQTLFLQFFSIKSSFNFFFLKFWLVYRKFLLIFSSIFTPLTKFFNYLKILKILLHKNFSSKVSNWFFKSIYSRFFIQKLAVLTHIKKFFETDSKTLNTFFLMMKSFISPSVLFINKSIIERSLYKGFLVINSVKLETFKTQETSEQFFNIFNTLLKDNLVRKISFKLLSQKDEYNQFIFFFDKYFNENNPQMIFIEYLKFLYSLVVKNLNDIYLLEKFLSEADMDLMDTFTKKTTINNIQKKFINLSLQRSLNSFFKDYKKSNIEKQNNFFDEIDLQFFPNKNDLKIYINTLAKKNLDKSLHLTTNNSDGGSFKYNLNNKWSVQMNKKLNNSILFRNIKKQNLKEFIPQKKQQFDKKPIYWRHLSILPSFKRYKRFWKSRNWTRNQSLDLHKFIVKKKLEVRLIKHFVKKNKFFERKLKDFQLDDVINRYTIRKIFKGLNKNLSTDYNYNEILLKNGSISPYFLNKNYLKKTNNIKFFNPKNKVLNEYLLLKQILNGLVLKTKMFKISSNSKYFLNYLKKQMNLWKKNFINLIGSLNITTKHKFNKKYFIIKSRKIVNSIKHFLDLTFINLKTLKWVCSINKVFKYLESLLLLVKSIDKTFLLKIKKIKTIKKNSLKTWLKFRLRLNRSTKNSFFKRQFFKRSLKIDKKISTSIENLESNKIFLIKHQITNKPYLKNQVFIRRSKKRRKSYKLGQKPFNQRWLKKRKKRYCDINLIKWNKLKLIQQEKTFNKEIWFKDEQNFIKKRFFNNLRKKIVNLCLLEKFFIIQNIIDKNEILLNNKSSQIKRSYFLNNINVVKNSQKRNSLFFQNINKKESYSLDIIKVKRGKKKGRSNLLFDKYKKNYSYLFKLNKLRRYKNLITYHQRWNKGSTTRIRYQMRTKLLNLNKIRRLRKKKFFNIRTKPLLLIPNFVEFDFVTFRSYVLSTPNLEASLYGGATNSYFYSFLSFYQRLGY